MSIRRIQLARARRAVGYTQEDLATALHVERSTVHRWESGRSEPLPYLRGKLAMLLEVTRGELESMLCPLEDPGVVSSAGQPKREVERTAKALNDNYRDYDGTLVDFFRERLDNSMTHDGSEGPRAALPEVLGLLRAVELRVTEAGLDGRRDLLALGACGAEFAGWLYRDSNNPVRAAYWYDRAMEWAQESGDYVMQSYLLLKKSQMAYDARDPARVAALAQAAENAPWKLPSKVRAEIIQQRALGLAVTGGPADLVRRRLGEAQEILANHVGDDRDLPNAYFTGETLLLRNASTFTEAGNPALAASLFADVLRKSTLSRRDMAYFSARRATALALSGEPDEAANIALVACEDAAATRSQRTIRVLRDAVITLKPWQGRPSVRSLRDAVHGFREIVSLN